MTAFGLVAHEPRVWHLWQRKLLRRIPHGVYQAGFWARRTGFPGACSNRLSSLASSSKNPNLGVRPRSVRMSASGIAT